MQGYSPKLPLSKDATDGLYAMNKTTLETIKQDFKMLVLTNPGERIMLPDYGVGLRALLFSQAGLQLNDQIRQRILSQVSKYMKFIQIQDIKIDSPSQNENSIYIAISYFIPSLNTLEELNLSLASN